MTTNVTFNRLRDRQNGGVKRASVVDRVNVKSHPHSKLRARSFTSQHAKRVQRNGATVVAGVVGRAVENVVVRLNENVRQSIRLVIVERVIDHGDKRAVLIRMKRQNGATSLSAAHDDVEGRGVRGDLRRERDRTGVVELAFVNDPLEKKNRNDVRRGHARDEFVPREVVAVGVVEEVAVVHFERDALKALRSLDSATSEPQPIEGLELDFSSACRGDLERKISCGRGLLIHVAEVKDVGGEIRRKRQNACARSLEEDGDVLLRDVEGGVDRAVLDELGARAVLEAADDFRDARVSLRKRHDVLRHGVENFVTEKGRDELLLRSQLVDLADLDELLVDAERLLVVVGEPGLHDGVERVDDFLRNDVRDRKVQIKDWTEAVLPTVCADDGLDGAVPAGAGREIEVELEGGNGLERVRSRAAEEKSEGEDNRGDEENEGFHFFFLEKI